MENPNIVYGQITAYFDIAGFSFEKAVPKLEYILNEKRWKEVGTGYDNINDFLRSLTNYWSQWKITAEQRKRIASLIKENEEIASNVAIADMLGVDEKTIRNDSSENSEIKEKTDIEYQEVIDNSSENSETPETSGAKLVQKEQKKTEKQKEKEQKREEKAKAGAQIEIAKKDIDFRLGDFIEVLADIPDGSIDCIITDPPYPKEFIECWSNLSKFAKRVLKPNGFCIAYSGQMNLPEVIKRMSEHLDYYWMFSLLHTGSRQLINGRSLFCGWKPILIFQNGFKKLDSPFDDFITGSGMEKSEHRWQQAKEELYHLIENFTNPGDLIVEPFAGGGTTIIACIDKNRRIIAAEKDKESYNIAKGRVWKSWETISTQS